MPCRALYAAILVSVVSSSGCSSDSGARPGGGAGSTAGGEAAGGAVAGGVAGAGAMAGTSAAGQSSGGVSAGTGGGGSASSSVSGGGGAAGAPGKAIGTPLVYVGGFGDFPLQVYELNKQTGALTQRGGDEPGGASPAYLALDPSGTHLYNVNQDNGNAAGVTAHHIKADGTLEPLNHQQGTDDTPASCNGSCGFTHLAVDPSSRFVIAANYEGGSVSVFPINADGSLGAQKQLLDFGSQSLAHAVAFDPTGKFAFVPTLGADKVQQLLLDPDGTLTPNTPPDVASAAGAGPRHMSVHPNGKLAFVMNETASSITSYKIAADGTLSPGASVSSLPVGVAGETYGQHIKVSPDGRFVYGSNVGHDSIAVLAVDQTSGALTPLQDQPSGGALPRDFDVDPNGELLVAANRGSDSLAVFAIGQDGKLTPLGQPTKVVSQPTSVVIRYNK